jgi:hypothetical protein
MNSEETSTSELVDIIKQQAESFQKPNEDNVVWRELMVRYGWIGCPKEDLVLISSLDPLLQRLNNCRTMLPPRAVQHPNTPIQPPPKYYRSKITLSQVVNLKTAKTSAKTSFENAEPLIAPSLTVEISKMDSQQSDKTLPQNRNSLSLDKLRSELTDSQKKYLNLFWEHYLDCGQWPKVIDFHRDHEMIDVRNSLIAPPMNGGIILEQNSSGEEHYELTLIGILLTKDGKHYEEMRIRLLEFLSNKYYHTKKNERRNRYSDEEIANEIKLNEDDKKMLGKVGEFDHIYRTYGSSSVGGHWAIEFPRKEIQSIPRMAPFSEYHERILSQQYYPQHKVFIEDRHAVQRPVTFPRGLFPDYFGAPGQSDSHSKEPTDAPPFLAVPDVSFVKDDKLRQFAATAAQEASRCFSAKAFTATAVMAGGATETVLLDLLLQHKDKLPDTKNGPIEKWQLDDLIKTAEKMNLLGAATSSLTQFVRKHRNLIHPGKFLREKRILDEGDAHIIWGIFMKICNELSSRSTIAAS